MATYGEIRFRLSKLAGPGVDLDLLDGWIADRYLEILDAIPWQRLEKQATFQTTAEYATGTCDVTNGSASISGTGTTWTTGMTGRLMRINNEDTFYLFTYVGGTSGTLDRAYEGDTDTELDYQINEHLITLPADVRILKGVNSLERPGELTRRNRTELDDIAPRRSTYGVPTIYSPHMDDASDPPQTQIEVYPIPNEARGFTYAYVAEVTAPSATGTTLLPWVRPGCLIAGVQADMAASVDNLNAAVRHDTRFGSLLRQMVAIGAARKGATSMKMAPAYTRHRVRRWLR